MSESPAKRRKTSPSTFVPGDAPDAATEGNLRTIREVSHRTSFQSPTRSSLARFNPDVLSNALNRSPKRSPSRPATGGRDGDGGEAIGLRDRKALRPSLSGVAPASPSKAPQMSTGFPILSPQRTSSAFSAPPRRVTRKSALLNTTETVSSNIPHAVTLASSPANDPDEQLAQELDSATGAQNIAFNLATAAFQDEEGEPDLPPTPTQLGLEKAPERSKGLLSSPSRQYQTRRNLRSGAAAFSPLKHVSRRTSPERQGSPEVLPEEVRKKQALRDELSQQLKSLHDDVKQLEDWTRLTKGTGHGSGLDVDGVRKLLKIISSSDAAPANPSASSKPLMSSLISTLLPFSKQATKRPVREASPLPVNPYALSLEGLANPLPYLTTFASVDLRSYSTSISTSSRSDESQPWLETHSITLSAPSPFPNRLLNVSFRFETDLFTQRVTSISIPPDDPGARIPSHLRAWMNHRLSNPLLNTDISSLCWGIGRYWDACVSRAQIWARLQRRHARLLPNDGTSKTLDRHLLRLDTEKGSNHELGLGVGISQLRLLMPHLERTSMLFSSSISPPAPPSKSRTQTQLLVSCDLVFDPYNAEPAIKPDISLNIVSHKNGDAGMKRKEAGSSKAERDLKRLFRTLLKESKQVKPHGDIRDVDAVIRAVEAVIVVMFGSEQSDYQRY